MKLLQYSSISAYFKSPSPEVEVRLRDTMTLFLGWAGRSDNGRWFSRKPKGSPPVWGVGAGARGCAAAVDGGGREMLEDNIGVRRRGGGGTGEEREGKDREVRTGNAGQSGGGEWNVSQEAFSALKRQDEGVCCRCRRSDSHQPAGEHMCDTVILTHTHILHSVTTHRLGRARSSYIL